MRPLCLICRGLGIAMMILLTGCAVEGGSNPVSFSSWQKSLEQYVWNQANGDPNVLRDMSWDDIHHGFSIISDPLPQRSTDAIGLLVSHRKIDQRPYFIFLFALVRERLTLEMRPVALTVEKGQFNWSIGPPDPAAMARYTSPSRDWAFPAPDDEFDTTISDDQITITHRQSGAAWRLNLSADFRP